MTDDFNALFEDFADTLPKLKGRKRTFIKFLSATLLLGLILYLFTGCHTVETFPVETVEYPIRLIVLDNFYNNNYKSLYVFNMKNNNEVDVSLKFKIKLKIFLVPENKEKLIIKCVNNDVNIYTNDIMNIGYECAH